MASMEGQRTKGKSLTAELSNKAESMSSAPPSERAKSPEQEDRFFALDYFKDDPKGAEKHRRRKAKNERLVQDMALREEHAGKAVRLAQVAVVSWLLLFAIAGTCNVFGKKFLNETALTTLTAGATVNVIAVFLVVVKGLFPAPVPKARRPKAPRSRGRSTAPARKPAKQTKPSPAPSPGREATNSATAGQTSDRPRTGKPTPDRPA